MAELRVEGDDLVVLLGFWERVGGFAGDIRVPLAQVVRARAVEDPWTELRGIRAPGTGFPGVIALGTRRGRFGKDFSAVYGHRPGVVVELSGAAFQRLVLTTERAEDIATAIRSRLG